MYYQTLKGKLAGIGLLIMSVVFVLNHTIFPDRNRFGMSFWAMNLGALLLVIGMVASRRNLKR